MIEKGHISGGGLVDFLRCESKMRLEEMIFVVEQLNYQTWGVGRIAKKNNQACRYPA